MRPVVLDTNVVLPALLSPGGLARKFWLLLALGALTARAEDARLEREAVEGEARALGATIGGRALNELAREAEAKRARLADRLPYGTPDEWRLVASRPLLDEYERKLYEVGPRLNPKLGADDVPKIRRQVEAVCWDVVEDFDPAVIPRYTPDRKDDAVVHTALLGGVLWLISDDKRHIAREPEGTLEYALPNTDACVSAITFGHFVEQHLDAPIDLYEVDGRWLHLAHEALGAR